MESLHILFRQSRFYDLIKLINQAKYCSLISGLEIQVCHGEITLDLPRLFVRELANSATTSQNQPTARTKDDLKICLPQISQLKILDDKSDQHHIQNEEPGDD